MVFLSGCNPTSDLSRKGIFGRGNLVVNNNFDSAVEFKLRINGRDFLESVDEIVKEVNQRYGPDHYLGVWKYTANGSYFNYPITEAYWIHNPVLFFNSLGFGFCDDVSSVNQMLWLHFGDTTRIWNLAGGTHIVSEVYNRNRKMWEMYDSDRGVALAAPDREGFLSVEEIESGSAKFNDSGNRVVIQKRLQERPDFQLWHWLDSLYSSTTNYFGAHGYDPNFDRKHNYIFQLPPNSTLEFGHKLNSKLRTDTINGKVWHVPSYNTLRLTYCNHIDSLSIQLDLLVHEIVGSGTVILNGTHYDLSKDQNKIRSLIDNREIHIPSVTLVNTEFARVDYIVSSVRFPLRKRNEFEARGLNSRVLKIRLARNGKQSRIWGARKLK
ncbi:MAG: hypothetical protein AB7O48_06720 [Cyclobacteriaceae bacterium]